jgi:hypothetical protein
MVKGFGRDSVTSGTPAEEVRQPARSAPVRNIMGAASQMSFRFSDPYGEDFDERRSRGPNGCNYFALVAFPSTIVVHFVPSGEVS